MTYASEVLADSPYLWWRLGEPSGTSAADTSGNGRTGTYNGSPTLAVAGAIGGDSDTAVQFDGVNDYVSRADTADLTAFTAEAWVKTTGSSGVIIARDNLNFAQRIFRIALNAGALEGIVWKNGSTLAAVTGPTINNGNWRHVALTYDGTTTRLYLDGSSVGTPSTTVSGALLTNDTAFSVGADAIGTNRFTGTIDEPAYYATALSGARIAAHYAAATPPPPITVHPAKITSIGTVHEPAIVPYVAPVDGNINITAELEPTTKHAACIQPDRGAEIEPVRHTAGVNAT